MSPGIITVQFSTIKTVRKTKANKKPQLVTAASMVWNRLSQSCWKHCRHSNGFIVFVDKKDQLL